MPLALPQVSLAAGRTEMLAYFENGWNLTELLFSGLADEAAFYRRPYHQLRHPMIFYYAHPAALYVNKLRVAGLADLAVHTGFETLFETGVDEMRWDDLHEDDSIWPSLEETRAYRQRVHTLVRGLIETHPGLADGHPPITQQDPLWALVMGFEHERIHLETSCVLMRELPLECVRRPAGWPDLPASGEAPENPIIAMPTCEVTLGKPDSWPGFGWDNEYGAETRRVRPFAASQSLISNAGYHEFVRDGGYAEERWWTRDGWSWRRFRNVKHPTFWVPDGPAGSHRYRLRTLFEAIDMAWNWPALVNFHEARAYCAWRTARDRVDTPWRSLTEAEHHALRAPGEPSEEANLSLRAGGEWATDASPANAHGFHDVFGNAWQWCEDDFHPLAGGRPHPYYDDFSAPCYDGEHRMILGGSYISAGDMAGPWARFHFRPHFFQHAGLRIARYLDGDPAADARRIPRSAYETQGMVDAYMLMHWGEPAEIFDDRLGDALPAAQALPLACAELVRTSARSFGRALDLGCAVGRASFEMARDFTEVVGLDYSREFVDAADTLRRAGEMRYLRKDSGSRSTPLTARVDAAIDRSRLRFDEGDACALPASLGSFDAVLLANVLCRLPDPAACLARLEKLVSPGGALVMTTPFSWLTQYTQPARWLENIDAVAALLPAFTLESTQEVPFMIREHRRKFEYIVTQASVWRRKA